MSGQQLYSGFRRWIMAAAMVGAATLAGPASAQVNGSAPSLSLGLGQTGTVNYTVTVADTLPIDGVNGEITFDAAVLSAPTVAAGPDAAGYTAEGNLMAPGKFRFVLYKNPPGPAVSGQILTFGFTAGDSVVGNVMSEATFTIGAAARIVTGGNVVSLGVTGGQAINFSPISISISGIQLPVITQAPENQTVNVNRTVTFRAAASGSGVGLTWRKGATVVGVGPTLTLSNVSAADAGTYTVDATNLAGTVSASATLTVLDPAVANAAEFVSNSLPSQLLPGAIVPFKVVMRNSSQVSWSADQLFAMVGVPDTGTSLQSSTVLIAPDAQVVQPGEEHEFTFVLNTPSASGNYQASLQMAEGIVNFGPVVSAQYSVGTDMVVDLTGNPAGWIGGIRDYGSTGATVSSGSQGLCMTVPGPGVNETFWVSPERYVPLADLTAYRLLVTPSTDQAQANAIPLWDIVYDNFNSSGFGNTYGGEQIFLDVSEGANGIGRVQGTQFQAWAMPLGAQTPQWRGMLSTGAPGENDNSAFTPFADASNDIRVTFRILDYANAPIAADLDFGTICISQLAIRSFLLANMGATQVWGPPINSQTHLPQNSGQAADGAGVAEIDDANARANFQLTAEGAGARKTLFPFDSATFDINNPGAFGPLYPVQWESNVLYRSTIEAEATVAETNPPDTVFVNTDVATNELVNIHVTLVGSPPDNMFRASSPRLPATVGGQPQKYSSFMYGHNKTLIDLGLFPNADKFRPQADFFNVPNINPHAINPANTGTDPFSVTKMYVETITLP